MKTNTIKSVCVEEKFSNELCFNTIIAKKVIKPNTISKIPLICYLYDPLYVQIHLGFHANYFL